MGSSAPASTLKEQPLTSACTVFGPIYWSAKDTDDTIKQVKEHNAAGKELCKW